MIVIIFEGYHRRDERFLRRSYSRGSLWDAVYGCGDGLRPIKNVIVFIDTWYRWGIGITNLNFCRDKIGQRGIYHPH